MAIRYGDRTPEGRVTIRATEVNQLGPVSDCHRRFVELSRSAAGWVDLHQGGER